MKRRTMVCVDCHVHLDGSSPGKARKLGWVLWDGGGRCAKCERQREQNEAAIAAKLTPVVAARKQATVICASCLKQLIGNEITPGVFWPTWHWLTTDENKRRLKEERKPIPLCPGIRQPATVVKVEDVA